MAANQPTTPADFALAELDPDHAVATWRNLLVIYWLGDTTPGAVIRLIQPLQRLAQRYADGVGLMQVVGAKTAAPSAESRAAIAKLMSAGAQSIVCSSLVVPGVGFRMAAARALATGLIMIARPPFPHQVYATVEEAAAWQCTLLPPGPHASPVPRDIIGVVRVLRGKLEEPARRRPRATSD